MKLNCVFGTSRVNNINSLSWVFLYVCYNSALFQKARMGTLKDVSLAEAGKWGTLNEYAFFDKVGLLHDFIVT